MAIRNKSTIASGMLAPSGYADTPVHPEVQATVRPAGVLLPPSPGFDSVRVGKNRFQGRGPTGGFRPSTFAEDVGGSGAALSVVPGETSRIETSEWLPENADSFPEGTFILADREHNPGVAMILHDGQHTIPDMGDRHPNRPLSRQWFAALNPTSVLRAEYQKSPALSVAMGAGLVYVAYLIGGEIERTYRSNRGRGVGSQAASVPAGAAQGAGDTASDAVEKIGEAGDKAVSAITDAADKAVTAISDAAESAKKEVTE